MSNTQALPDARENLARALTLGAVLLCAVYIVVRPLANQFDYYSGEAAFAGLVLCLLGAVCGAIFLLQRGTALPTRVALATVLWVGLLFWGAVHSPHQGKGIPYAADFGGYILLMLCGYVLAQRDRRIFPLVCRLLIAMALVEACSGLWQQWVDFPRLLENVKRSQELLPDALQSTAGQSRLLGGNVFGSFVYPNALGAYLLLGMVLLGGATVAAPRDGRNKFLLVPALVAAVAMLLASYYTGSKGALMALPAGAWAWLVVSQSERHPQRAKLLYGMTLVALIGLVAVLALATFGVLPSKPFGLSLQVRFEYWRSAWQMIGLEPLQGVGLGGFAEHYAFFKTPLGTEAKEVHNDYLQLWTELGIAGLLAYVGVWAMMLRGRFTIEPTPSNSTRDTRRSVGLEVMAVAGGFLAFAFMHLSFESLNSTDLFSLLRGEFGEGVLSGATFALTMPLLFAIVIIATRGLDDDRAMSWAAKAAICAVLLHELVDFDIRAQALLGAMFLLGGMFLAGTDQSNLSPPTRFERLGRAFPLLLSLALLPISFWIPAQSGIARASAEALEEDARDLGAKAKTDEERQKLPEIRRKIVELRQDALSVTPYDSEAWVDLAFAMEAAPLEGSESVRRKTVETMLLGARERRPFSHIPPTLLGNFHAKHDEWKQAVEWYAKAGWQYPLHPGLHLWLGDAHLMSGNVSGAANGYLSAFTTDQQINDTNVRLSAIFTDPRAGVFSRHTREAEVFQRVERELSKTKDSELDVTLELTLRRLVGLCALYREAERSKGVSEDALIQMAAEIRSTTQRFLEMQYGHGMRAHAALYVALSYEIRPDPALAAEKKSAWERAKQLHAEVTKRYLRADNQFGEFSTEESLFERLRQNYDK